MLAVVHGKCVGIDHTKADRIPDAVIFGEDGTIKSAIELELTSKSETRYRQIIVSYRLSPYYREVLYYVGNQSIKNKIEYAITGYPKSGFLELVGRISETSPKAGRIRM